MDYALNQYEVFKIIGYPVGFCLESNFDIHLMKNDMLLILLQGEVNHWVMLMQDYESIIFFNPAGIKCPDSIRTHVDYYMDLPLQSYNTNVCGRYCGFFGRLIGIGENNFENIFKNIPKKNRDKFIIDLTERYL